MLVLGLGLANVALASEVWLWPKSQGQNLVDWRVTSSLYSSATKSTFYFRRVNFARSSILTYLQWAPVRPEAQMKLCT